MDKSSYSMINELEIERYLKENFEVEFVDTPCFARYEIIGLPDNGQVVSTTHTVKTYLVDGLKSFDSLLSKDGLEKLYVFRDQMSNILFPIPNMNTGGDSLVIRMEPICKNIRFKLNKENERRSKTRRNRN